MQKTRSAAAAMLVALFVGFVLLAGIIFGGWQLGWWFNQQNANRSAHVDRSGYSNQQSLRDEITLKTSDYQNIESQIHQANGDPAFDYLKPQAHAVLNIICKDADQITGDPLSDDQQSFVSDHCQYGVAKEDN